jgi:hypothetical protein
MTREFRVVPVTKWEIVEFHSDGNSAGIETICELRDKERAERLAGHLAEKYGGTVVSE